LEKTQGIDGISLFCSWILFQNRSMIYGYARVSTEAQDLTSQLAQLTASGCEKVFREKLTGTNADRPQLRQLITRLAPGDVVIIPAVDRLSRDTTDLLKDRKHDLGKIRCGIEERLDQRTNASPGLLHLAGDGQGRSYNVSPQTISRLA
jgi:hypothetical protein